MNGDLDYLLAVCGEHDFHNAILWHGDYAPEDSFGRIWGRALRKEPHQDLACGSANGQTEAVIPREIGRRSEVEPPRAPLRGRVALAGKRLRARYGAGYGRNKQSEGEGLDSAEISLLGLSSR